MPGYFLESRLMVSVPILGEIYAININATDEDTAGECSNIDQTITLSTRLKAHPDYLWRVLLHEIGHAYIFESGLAEILTDREQELIAQTCGSLMNQLFEKPAWVDELLK